MADWPSFKNFSNTLFRSDRSFSSSRFLECRLVEAAGINSAKTIVELGPGTGGTTRAILKAMAQHSVLLSIEINPHLHTLVSRIDDDRHGKKGCGDRERDHDAETDEYLLPCHEPLRMAWNAATATGKHLPYRRTPSMRC